MSDERKQRPVQRPEREPRSTRLGEDRRSETERQASPIERHEWRGAGVCGDQHTD